MTMDKKDNPCDMCGKKKSIAYLLYPHKYVCTDCLYKLSHYGLVKTKENKE